MLLMETQILDSRMRRRGKGLPDKLRNGAFHKKVGVSKLWKCIMSTAEN